MLTNIHLHGHLGVKYGAIHRFDVNNACQATRALAANYPGFTKDFIDGIYNVRYDDIELDETQVNLRVGKNRTIHIIPLAAGAKKSGALKIIVGIALIAITAGGAAAAIGPFAAGASGFGATAFTVPLLGTSVTWGALATQGAMMVLAGASSLLTPTPKAGDYGNRNPVDQRASFLFNGATNRSAEGTAKPIVYGQFRTGSVIASAGMTVEQLLST